MIGSEGVARALVRRLRDTLNPRLTELRIRYETTASALPDVALVDADEPDPISIEKFPAVFVVPVDTTGRQDNRQTAATGSYDEYSFTYNVQIYVYARGETKRSTSLRVKRYTLAVRECLLGGRQLLSGIESLSVEPKTIRESYSQVGQLPEQKDFIGGAYIDVQIVSEERIESTIGAYEVTIAPTVGVTTDTTKGLPAWNLDV
ncbi:hypothetical protein SEA_SICARIUS2_14 [Arthrobacter phage Sicarius2]|uniref:Tail terminator n=1 Tax=Arthrobacter phage Sicarius2 TaxID=2836090 RepID=A0A8F3EA34_9CAUD|nr:hypothetical protein SEA_SICARIUS2_14 [Arthrobacter phage Sicarius2]